MGDTTQGIVEAPLTVLSLSFFEEEELASVESQE
jgi:hypothetical protein